MLQVVPPRIWFPLMQILWGVLTFWYDSLSPPIDLSSHCHPAPAWYKTFSRSVFSAHHSSMLTPLSIALRNQIPTRYIRGFYLCWYTLYPRLVRPFPPLRVLQLPHSVAGTNPENWANVLEYSLVLVWPVHCKYSLHIQTKTNSSSFSGVLQAAVYQ